MSVKESQSEEMYKFEIDEIYQNCWLVFTKYFYDFYADILLTNSKYELSPIFKNSPYSMKVTKDYILSIKEKT